MASMAFPRNVNPFELVMYKMLSTKKTFRQHGQQHFEFIGLIDKKH